MIQLLPTSLDDFETIYQIELACYPIPWTEQVMRDVLSSPYLNFKVVLGNTVIGYIFLLKILDEATILNIAVSPDFQNKGYGYAILEHSIKILREENVHMLLLEVRVSNMNAQFLYNKFGFNQIDIRKNYYAAKNGREDAIIMAMSI